jgi:hypothetical protein
MKLAICIPFRDTGDGVRQGHLDKFIPHLTEFLNERNIEHKFFIGHQDDDNLFNRSLMKNVPFIVAKEQGYDYFAFHDVDMLPEDDSCDYSYPKDHPVQIATYLSQWDYNLRDVEYFGGCVLFTKEQFEQVNGYNPNYWDWGFEDDDLFYRCHLEKMSNQRQIDGPGKTKYFNFDGNTHIEIPVDHSIARVISKDCKIEIITRPDVSKLIKYLIGDTNREYTHLPLMVRQGYDWRLAYDNSRAYSATFWSWRNDLHYIWAKQQPSEWTKLTYLSKDKEHYLMINDKYEDGRHGSGTKLPLSIDIPLKRYARVPYWIGKDSEDVYFTGDIAEIKITNHRDDVVLHYDFSEIDDSDLQILDKSGYENHGILHGNLNIKEDTIDKLTDLPIPHRRYGRYKCLHHEDLGIVEGKFQRGNTTAENERIYRTKMQSKELDYKNIGLNSSKYEIISTDYDIDTNVEMINIKTFYDN